MLSVRQARDAFMCPCRAVTYSPAMPKAPYMRKAYAVPSASLAATR